MKTTRTLALLFAGGCLILLAAPLLAQGNADRPAEPIVATATAEAPLACLALPAVGPKPVPLSTCFISVECDDGSVISCSGNTSCSTSGENNRCVTCDGVQQGCCAKTCCEVCQERLDSCLQTCGPLGFPPSCNACSISYDICTGNCQGGC